MTPYSIEQVIVVADADTVCPVPFPGRCVITRVAATRLDDGEGTELDLYSRAFFGDVLDVRNIEEDTVSGDCRVRLYGTLIAKIGDPVTIVNGGNIAYDTSHRIVSMAHDLRSFLSDVAFDSGPSSGGQAQLLIPSSQWELYRVMPTLISSSPESDTVDAAADVVFVNMDPLPNANIGVKRMIYARFGSAGTYKVVLTAKQSVALGD